MTTTAEHQFINRDKQVQRLAKLHQRLGHEFHRLERAIRDVKKDFDDVDRALAARVSDLKAMMTAQSYGIPGAGPVRPRPRKPSKKAAADARMRALFQPGHWDRFVAATTPKRKKTKKKTTKRKAR